MMLGTGLKVSVVVVQSHFQVQPNFIVVKLGRVDVVVGVVTIDNHGNFGRLADG